MSDRIWTNGRVAGVLCLVAIPFVAVWSLGGLAKPAAVPVRMPWEQPFHGAIYAPAPLPDGESAAGVTFVAGSQTDVRGFARLALYVPAGRPAADFLPAGAFVATFRGRLRVPRRDRYQFTFLGTGEFELVIGGKRVLHSVASGPATGERVRLRKGEQPFTVTFKSPATGPALMRVYWQSRDFPREPIPARALSHGSSPMLAQYAKLRRGRELVQELRCANCHERAVAGRGAPSLFDVGSRLRPDWLAAWIENPRHLRATATMPALVVGDDAAPVADDLAAYLGSLGAPPAALVTTAAERQAGGEIFVDYGCLACHTLPSQAVETAGGAGTAAAGRVSLAYVKAKWWPAALVEFLRNPTRHYPDIRMPDYGFSAAEAKSVAAFLLGLAGSAVAPRAGGDGDVAAGQVLAQRLGCAECHGMPVPSTLRARPRPVANNQDFHACGAADYGLSIEDRAALREYLTRRRAGRFTAVEAATRAVRAHRCGNCHGFDGQLPIFAAVRHEADALVPSDPSAAGGPALPDLTVAGAKLRTEWLVAWLDGAVESRPRPWLTMPMPRFRLDAAELARGLAFRHGLAVTGEVPSLADGMLVTVANAPATDHGRELGAMLAGADAPVDAPAGVSAGALATAPVDAAAKLAAIGAMLLSQAGGFGCTNCHDVGEVRADSVFEAPGIDLALATTRLRKEYFHRWMFDPTRVDPATKMTRFLDPDGQSGLTTILGGRGWAQIEAIWRYLATKKLD